MEGVKEYADEPVVFEKPTNMQQLLQSKSIKDRLQALNYLIQEIVAGNPSVALEVEGSAFNLVKEENEAALSKSLEVVEALLQMRAVSALSVLSGTLEHAASIKEEIKDSVRFIALQAAGEDLGQTLAVMEGFSNNKQVKLVVEISILISSILEEEEVDIELLEVTLPFLTHVNGDIRKPVIDLIVKSGSSLGKSAILRFLKQGGVSDQVISSFENQLASDVEGAAAGNEGTENGKFDYDEFDEAIPEKFTLGKGFEDKMKNPNWKERKQAIEEALDSLKGLARIEPFDTSRVVLCVKMLAEEEKTVEVVELALKLLGLLSIKIGTLGTTRELEELLESVENRTKEKKYAIVNGYQIFIESLVVRAYNFSQLQNELFQVAIPHKNIEVREELLHLIKVCCASEIIYYLRPIEEDIDSQIAILSNDYFPNPVFPNTEEPLPANGEKSLGMELEQKGQRERSASGFVFVQFFINGAVNTHNLEFPAEAYESFFCNLDKILNDTNATIRELAYRAAGLFIVANIFEGSDAICRSEECPSVIAVYNEMYELFIHFITTNRRRSEIQTIICEINKFTGVSEPFANLLQPGNFSQAPSFEKNETRAANKEMTQTKIDTAIRTVPSEQAREEPKSQMREEKQSEAYEQRMESGTHILIDANNSKAPVTIEMLDEIHGYLSLISEQPQMYFMKDVLKTTFGSQGNFKWLTSNISDLLSQNAGQFRDIILIYLSLIIADGFLVKSQVSPLHIKFFYESLCAFVQTLQSEDIQLNKYDLECILPVILQKLEEQSTTTAKELLFKAFDEILSVSESLEEVIITCLKTVSKENKIQIRQITTKVSILRLIAGLCFEFERQNMRFEQLLPLHLSGLEEFYLNKQAENYVLTDSIITRLIPENIVSEKQLSIYIVSVAVQCSPTDIEEKLLSASSKYMQESDLVFSESSSSVEEQAFEQAARRATYQNVCPPQLEANHRSNAQAATFSAVTNQRAVFEQSAPQVTAEAHSELSNEPVFRTDHQPEHITYEPFEAEKTPIMAPKQEEHAEFLDFPDTLVEVPEFPSPLPSRHFPKVIETPNLQDIMESHENQKYAELCDFPLDGDCASAVVQLLKHFVRSLREEQSTIYLESQVEHLALRIVDFLEFFGHPGLLGGNLEDQEYYLIKYSILALAQLSQAELFHQTHVYKKVLTWMLPHVTLFATSEGRSQSFSQCEHIIGLFEGFWLQLAEISDIFRLSAVLLQALSQLTKGQADSRLMHLISQNQDTENHHFSYYFLLGLIQRLQPQLVRDLQQEISKRQRIVIDLTNCENPIPLEPQLRPDLVEYWNGADLFMFELHLIQLCGSFKIVDDIMRSLGEMAVFIMGKVPDESELRKKLGW